MGYFSDNPATDNALRQVVLHELRNLVCCEDDTYEGLLDRIAELERVDA